MAPPCVPPSQPSEHQYWTDPILCEETRARLEHFRSLGWLPPNFKPKTLEGLAVVERYWRKYCIQLSQDYMCKTSRKKLLQSYDEYWRRLCQYFGLFARRRVNGDIHEQMRRFLEHVFPAERKVPRRIKQKNTLDVNVFCVTYHHYWVHSKHFRHGMDDLPALVCYRDIELFYLKDPDSKRDVLCAIIEFRNLKGRPEGADGTKFFMHGDYQLAYCPINQNISLAFRDEAFFNTALTPELIWRLRITLPMAINFTSLPMTYDSSRTALQELGRDARFEDDIGHYNYCWWTANEVNRNFTSQERQRVLGQSGDAVFEKYYQSQFINRDLQHVVLLRPSQEGLMRAAGSMLRKRDPLAPADLTDAQKRTIYQNPEILELRREKRELMEEM
ncbi:hypothetical protein ASPSYDRAFT_86371 [Aspergillus sydowii CBS 593.65]|uniref:Uncharacterized protein n=1 Tax=Aspergillus sydowii CBS 593.65 TaxID=1036612 RepID=A0A1L9TTE6_9EURO|nr:uncharacterized protein ASPSYDRAFT_86371 [Aspergillus sydowii CBS 593.65]OJJ62717.1 hypothetical protein ASPSYDRAFT_86371 [Aspergillus sydowii CBS 593.65]